VRFGGSELHWNSLPVFYLHSTLATVAGAVVLHHLSLRTAGIVRFETRMSDAGQ